jgi:hypothetical protein
MLAALQSSQELTAQIRVALANMAAGIASASGSSMSAPLAAPEMPPPAQQPAQGLETVARTAQVVVRVQQLPGMASEYRVPGASTRSPGQVETSAQAELENIPDPLDLGQPSTSSGRRGLRADSSPPSGQRPLKVPPYDGECSFPFFLLVVCTG